MVMLTIGRMSPVFITSKLDRIHLKYKIKQVAGVEMYAISLFQKYRFLQWNSNYFFLHIPNSEYHSNLK